MCSALLEVYLGICRSPIVHLVAGSGPAGLLRPAEVIHVEVYELGGSEKRHRCITSPSLKPLCSTVVLSSLHKASKSSATTTTWIDIEYQDTHLNKEMSHDWYREAKSQQVTRCDLTDWLCSIIYDRNFCYIISPLLSKDWLGVQMSRRPISSTTLNCRL